MPDIFDQLAPDQTAGATGDIFDQITAKPAATTTPVADTPKLPLAPMPNVPMKTALTPAEFWRRGMEFADKGQRNLQQLVGLANAGNFTGEGAIIEPPALSEELQKQRIEGAKQAWQAGPILPVSELAPNPGFVHGALKVAEGLTTPQNLAILAATQGTAEAALALKGWPLAAVRALNLSLGGYFTYHFGKDAGAQVSDAWKAFQAHDYERVAEDLGAGTVDGLMAAFGIHHGLKSGNELLKTPVPNLPETRTDLWSIGHSGSFARSTPEVMPDLGAPEAPLATVPKPPVTIDVQPETVPPGDGTAPPAPAPAPVSPATFAERQAAALAWARQNPDARISQIQRQFGLGYGTAAKIMRQLDTGRAPGAAVPAAPEPPPSPAPAPEPPNSTPEITVTPAPPPVGAEDAPYAQKTGPNSLETNKEQFPVQKLSEETKGEEQAKTEEGKLSEVAPPSAPTPPAGDVFDAVAPPQANAGDVFDAVAPEEKATSQEGAKPEVATEGEATPPAQPSGFTTSKGSTYTVAGNGTKRLKKVTGEEFAASDRTVYVTPDVNQRLLETLQALGADSSVRAAIRTVGGNQLAIVVKDRKTGDVRNDLSKTFAYTEKPALGLHPVEVWNKNPETGEYGYHLGHAITKIDRAAKPSEVATEAEATPNDDHERPAAATSVSVREPVDNLPHPKMPALVDALEDRIANGPAIKDTPALVKLASEVLGNALTAGKYDVKDLYDALETAVNRYIASDGRIMQAAPADALKSLEVLLRTLPTQTARTKEQKQFQQFSTPPTLSYLAVKAGAIRPGETALEPSAGTGSLAAFLQAAGAHVETNELSPSRAAFLELQGYQPTSVNAERIRDFLPNLKPSVVVMNPPFSATAGRTNTNKNSVGYQHVLSALDMLPIGGRLVAILGRGASFDHPTALPFFNAIKKRGATVRANIGLDGSNYSKYGTTFDNRLIIVDKVPDAGTAITGDFKDLADAYDALQPVIDTRPAPEGNSDAGSRDDLAGRPDGSGADVERPLSEGESGNGKRGSGRRGPRQSDVHVEPAGPGGDVAPTERPELASGPADAVTPSPTDHARNPESSERHQPLVELETRDRSNEAVERQGTYQQYRPAKLVTGISHEKATGTGLVETGAMASVEPPDISYHPQLPASIINNGHVTDAQLESVAYAGQAHSVVLPNGKRAGFMIGDGTGVGKGTEAAAIALDNWNQGRRKILWLSLKPGLIKQAQRDLDWVEAPIEAKMLNDYDFSEPIDHEGVIFATYSMLHRVAAKQGGGSRIDQILGWNPDLILMDESHAAKNAVANGQDEEEESPLRGTASKAGQAVLDLDDKLPDARFTYMSATAFTDVRNLGYASRLGLWGDGTSFPEGFKDFNVQIDRGGYGAMELVAKEMKAMGRYIARQISFEGVSFHEEPAHLSAAQKEMYDAAVNAWQTIFRNIDKAIEVTTGADEKKAKGLQRMRAVSQFWSTNQRFYRNLITAMKIPTVIAEIEKALAKNHSVFIDLVSTGEAEAQRQLVKATEENLSFDELDMSAKAMILNFLDNSFPTQVFEEYVDENKQKRTRAVLDAQGNPVHSQEAIALRDAIKKDLEKIQLPQGPMDQIIDYFGPDAVAEVSGRKSRIVQDQKTGRAVEVQRVKPKGASAKDVNDWERQNFQSGKKRIAIASGAGGTGFDFHSDKRNANQQRRTHIVLEPSWSADQQMQKFGRTHRTNQANAPEYILIASDLGGEKRFISAIAARIASLGALTRGERKAGGGAAEMLAKYNLEGKYGEAAKSAFFTGLAGGKAVLQDDVTVNIAKPPTELEEIGPMAVCRLLGVVTESDEGPRVNTPSLKQFLNRMLNLPTPIQGAAFNYFMESFDRIIQAVKDAGAFDEGTQELKAIRSQVTHREVLRQAEDGTQTHHITVEAEMPADKNDWETAVHHVNQGDHSDYNQTQHAGLYRNVRSGQVWMARKSTKDITDQASGAILPAMTLIGPRVGSRQTIPVGVLSDKSKYERIPNGNAKAEWEKALAEIPDTYTEDVHLINGSVLPVWRQLGASGDNWKMNVVSVPTENGGQITGIRIPADQVGPLRESLGGGGMSSPSILLNRIWRQGERIALRDAQLSAGRVMGERAIVIQPAKPSGREVLERLGLPHIETAASVRYYLPYSDSPTAQQTAETVDKLGKILEAFPLKLEASAASEETNYSSSGGAGALVEHLQRLFQPTPEGEPERIYSSKGALQNKLVRNLSQIAEVSPASHRAAVQLAASEAQASALLRSAMPEVVKALGGKITQDEFIAGLVESRLRGTAERWLDLADATESVPKDDLVAWILSGPLEVLAQMGEDDSLAQQAASLAQNLEVLPKSKQNRNADQRLRDFVAGAFSEAADSVHAMMTADQFDELTAKPEFQNGLQVYKKLIEPTLAESHKSNEGVFSDALGPLATYFPLTPVRTADKARAALGVRKPYKKPNNINNRFTTGLAEDYDTGMEAFRKKVSDAFRVNNKAALLQTLESQGLIRRLPQGQKTDSISFAGRTFRAKVVEVGPARVIVGEDGKIIRIPAQMAAIPEPFYHELKPILDPADQLPPSWLKRFTAVLNALTLAGPADMVFHSHNLLGTLVANTPFIGSDLLSKTIGNTPVTKVLTALYHLATVDPMDEHAARDIREMAKLGLIPERYASTTYSAAFAKMTGAQKATPGIDFGPMLYGPQGIDIRARLIMYRLAKEINPNAAPLDLYLFVNQLGNYTESLQGSVERSLKRTGFSPFFTAGSTMLRNGIDAWTGTGHGSGPGGGKKNRLAQMLSGGALGVVAAWILAYYLYTGQWPWADKRAKLGKIPASKELRESKIGRILWGNDIRKVGYINFFGASSTLVGRGAHGLGIDGVFNTQRAGGNAAQLLEAGERDVLNSALHPVAGPPVRVALAASLGKQAFIVRDRNGGKTLASALPKNAPIGSAPLYAAKELNSLFGNVGAAIGFGAKEPEGTLSDSMIRMLFEMAGSMSGTISPATNPNAERKALADERRRHH